MERIEVGYCANSIFSKIGKVIKYRVFFNRDAAKVFVHKIKQDKVKFIWHILVNGKEVEEL